VLVIQNTNVTEILERHGTQIWFLRHFDAHESKSNYCVLTNNFKRVVL